MLLAIDIGNTNLTLGLYRGKQLTHHWRMATDHARMPDEYGLQILGLLGAFQLQAFRTARNLHGFRRSAAYRADPAGMRPYLEKRHLKYR